MIIMIIYSDVQARSSQICENEKIHINDENEDFPRIFESNNSNTPQIRKLTVFVFSTDWLWLLWLFIVTFKHGQICENERIHINDENEDFPEIFKSNN